MTNKINGIDVSECEFYNNYECNAYRHEYCEPEDNTKDMCEWHENCYFKQLKRLQEENNILKQTIKNKNFVAIVEENEGLKQQLEIDKNQINYFIEENEKIKKQYNCYACGNCNGKEDYINLEKHHKGLRKQFDELVKRNNTLSLRIEELENEKEKSKELEEIREMLKKSMSLKSNAYNHFINVEKAIDKINEVLNDR